MPIDEQSVPIDVLRRRRQVLRYAIGITLSVALAFGAGGPLAFITPVLAASFLGLPGKALGIRAGFQILLSMAGACIIAALLTLTLIDYMLVFVPLIGLLLLRVYYAGTGGASPLLVTWMLIAFALIPVLGLQADSLVFVVIRSLLLAGLVGIGLTWIMHGLLPDPATAEAAVAPKPDAGMADAGLRFASARRSTAVVFPVVATFLYFDFSSAVLVLVFITLLSMQPDASKGFKGGMALITGNAMGGIAAIVVYNLLVMVPAYGFLLLLVMFLGLWFGERLFSGSKKAPLYGMAFSTALLLIGSVTLTPGGEAGTTFYVRILQIMAAVLYVVVAFGLLERLDRQRADGEAPERDASQDPMAGAESSG